MMSMFNNPAKVWSMFNNPASLEYRGLWKWHIVKKWILVLILWLSIKSKKSTGDSVIMVRRLGQVHLYLQVSLDEWPAVSWVTFFFFL